MLRRRVRKQGGHDSLELRAAVQRFVRSFGLLASDRTPCGTPISTSYAHALMALREVGERGEVCSQQALARVLGLDKSNVTRLCAKMEAAGHIRQARSKADGRARLLALTAAGLGLAERVEVSSRERFDALLAALPSDRQRAEVVASFEVLNDALSRMASREESA